MTRMAVRAAALAIAVVSLSACSKSGSHQGDSSGSQAANGVPDGWPDGDAAAMFATDQFQSVLMLSLNIDGNDGTVRLQAMNGVDPKQTYGATYEQSSIQGCSTGQAYSLNITPGLDNNVVMAWLQHEHLAEVATYTINYPNAQFPGYGTSNLFYCPFITDAIRPYMPAETQNGDIHHGIRLILAHRVFNAWTFSNRYETQFPGKGNVKVFAGTFTYHFDSNLPGVSSGVGTASAKVYFDPDTGRWTLMDYQQNDPPLSFQTQ